MRSIVHHGRVAPDGAWSRRYAVGDSPVWRRSGIRAGLIALALSWAIALASWVLLVDPGTAGHIAPETFGVWLIVLGVWQVLFFVATHGRPFTRIARRGLRLPIANVVTLALTVLTYPALRTWAGLTTAASPRSPAPPSPPS
jgi:hypothetical protein